MSTNDSNPVNRKIHFIVIYSLIGATFIIAIIALVLALTDLSIRDLEFSLDKGASLIGIMVSVIGIVITGYFVVLAIDAYSHVKRISELTSKADEFKRKYEDHERKIQELSDFYLDYLYNDLNDRIASIGSYGGGENQEAFSKEKKNLVRKRAKLALLFPEMKYDMFVKLINELGQVGDENDLNELQQFEKTVLEPNKQGKIKEVIRSIIDRISATRSKI